MPFFDKVKVNIPAHRTRLFWTNKFEVYRSGCNIKAPGGDLQGPVGVKNEGRSLFIFYKLTNIYNRL